MSLSIAALSRLPPERAHAVALGLAARAPALALRLLARRYVVPDPRLEVRVLGLTFPNPLGLAAGYDKDGVAVPALVALGFGHVEVGTVTLAPQAGNAGVRLVRVREAGALVNRLGFPSAGAAVVRENLARARALVQRRAVVGVNVGKNRATPLGDAPAEYAALYRELADVADYVTLNVSSPNTAGLRTLQDAHNVSSVVGEVVAARAARGGGPPVLLKVAPDLDEVALGALVDAALDAGVDGLVATNTTLSRDGLPSGARSLEGGMSGRPLAPLAQAALRGVLARVRGRVPVIAVGGIGSAEDALARLRAGAALVQIYTALVYRGPGLAREIQRGVLEACAREGVDVAGLAGGRASD